MPLRHCPEVLLIALAVWMHGLTPSLSQDARDGTKTPPQSRRRGHCPTPGSPPGAREVRWVGLHHEPSAAPGAYWWWPGNAVTEDDITWNLETYRSAGWGNMGVIGIYGVRGEEDRFIDIFTPKWFEMYNHAVAEAKRLGMNIDLTPGSGWRLGGPHITSQHAEQNFAVEDGRIIAQTRSDRVKRAGPGGIGLAANPYSQAAVEFHFDWIANRFAEGNGVPPRAFYYDSFENPGNWCPEFLDSFEQLRGYSLNEQAESLIGEGEPERAKRVLCDYRETLSDVLIARVDHIVDWVKQRGSSLRMQAHGAPANLLDMYAAAGIPETEVFGASEFDIPGYRRDPMWIAPDQQSDLVNRFASSAAHVAGRQLVISESFTWLRNHYHTAISHIKAESDKLLLNGINGIYYHGVCFAPKTADWPGWLFYASTQANARNSIFRDIPALNAYITRCQSVLQHGRPHNDVLLYWPVYDLWMSGGERELRFKVHNPEWIEETQCGEAGRWMIRRGYTFDYVSDRQLLKTECAHHSLRTEGGSEYRTVLVPAAEHMKIATVQRLIDLATAGATVLIWKQLPQEVPGWRDHSARRQRLADLLAGLSFDESGVATTGKGKLIVKADLGELLDAAAVRHERLAAHGLQFIRRKSPSHISYFIVNHSAQPVSAWTPLATNCKSAVLLDPMTARSGVAPLRIEDSQTQIYLQMQPGDTRVLRAYPNEMIDGLAWPITRSSGKSITLNGEWSVRFVEGGPVLPDDCSTTKLKSWTEFGDEEAKRFAGAARYTTTLNLPEADANGWLLDLGDVRESARVWVNGEPAGIVVAHPFHVDLAGLLKAGDNELTIEVTNLSANRIRDLDRRGVNWKKFHDINIVSQLYKPFDASDWPLKPSGLLGPVTLSPYRVPSPENWPSP